MFLTINGFPTDARIAQLVEHAIENRSVVGSNPTPGTTFSPTKSALLFEIAA